MLSMDSGKFPWTNKAEICRCFMMGQKVYAAFGKIYGLRKQDFAVESSYANILKSGRRYIWQREAVIRVA